MSMVNLSTYDAKTIDATSQISFKNSEAKERWVDTISKHYLSDEVYQIAMDFARCWAKFMQHVLSNNGNVKLSEIILPSCKTVLEQMRGDYKINVTCSHIRLSLELLKDVWVYGDILTQNLTWDTLSNYLSKEHIT